MCIMRTSRLRFTAAVAITGMMACSPRERACAVGAESTEMELVAIDRYLAGIELLEYPELRSDSVILTLSRDRIAGDTVFGYATGPLSDLGINVGPDTLPTRPFFAVCRGDSIFVTLDPRVADGELWLQGRQTVPASGTWSTAAFPLVKGEFRLYPRQSASVVSNP